ncbi:MAG: hypothetical protein ACHRHE_04235 [Tepidisphaerales bacterium]
MKQFRSSADDSVVAAVGHASLLTESRWRMMMPQSHEQARD